VYALPSAWVPFSTCVPGIACSLATLSSSGMASFRAEMGYSREHCPHQSHCIRLLLLHYTQPMSSKHSRFSDSKCFLFYYQNNLGMLGPFLSCLSHWTTSFQRRVWHLRLCNYRKFHPTCWEVSDCLTASVSNWRFNLSKYFGKKRQTHTLLSYLI
jgi:hypothetical protein